MTEIQYRWMENNEVVRLAVIDRTERIRTGYRLTEGRLAQMDVVWDAPPWDLERAHPHSIAAQIEFCREHLARDGRMYGAFAGEKLIGLGLLQPEVRPGIAQLAFLHVSRLHRRMGIGDQIVKELIQEAKTASVAEMYVSATPSGSAVGFYLALGFRPTADPLPELFELEPEDIHMRKAL